MGFFGSSCSAAITKNFGALTMSITSTARKATTLFVSFLVFDNECTLEHVVGICIFISALTAKSLRRKNKRRSNAIGRDLKVSRRLRLADLESGNLSTPAASFDSSDLPPSSLNSLGQDSTSIASQRRTPMRSQPRDGSPGRRSATNSPKVRHYVV